MIPFFLSLYYNKYRILTRHSSDSSNGNCEKISGSNPTRTAAAGDSNSDKTGNK